MKSLQVDAKNLLCPLPVIRCQDSIKQLQAGDRLSIYCTDPGAKNDIPAWCRINGHKVIDIEQKEREIVIHVEVGETN